MPVDARAGILRRGLSGLVEDRPLDADLDDRLCEAARCSAGAGTTRPQPLPRRRRRPLGGRGVLLAGGAAPAAVARAPTSGARRGPVRAALPADRLARRRER